MYYRVQERPAAWSGGAMLAATAVVAQVAAAWAAMLSHAHLSVLTLAVSVGAAIGSILIVARCRMPVVAKAGLLALASTSLLAWSATQNVSGLKPVEQVTNASVATVDPLNRRVAVHLTPDAGPQEADAAASVSAALTPALADSDVTVAVALEDAGGGPDRTFRLGWTLVRSDERLWCGEFTAPAPAPDLWLLADRVGAAVRKSRGGTLSCA